MRNIFNKIVHSEKKNGEETMDANCVTWYLAVHTYLPCIIEKNMEFYIVKHAIRHLITRRVL